MNQVIADNDLMFAADRKRNLWVAARYAYRVRYFSPSGRQKLEIALETQDSSLKETLAEDDSIVTFRSKTAIQTIVCDRSGTLYLIVSPSVTGSGTCGIDRYDGVSGTVERLLIDLPFTERLSAAAGRDGLYLVSFSSSGGAWKIPWESINQAQWTEVDGVRIGTRLQDLSD